MSCSNASNRVPPKVAPVLCGRDVCRWLKIASPLTAAVLFATHAHAGGLFLYEMATPDLGTASAGRAAAADNAATAFGNPAGMTRLDQSQMLVGIQPAYGITHFDKGNETTVSGGNGGNALGFIPGLGGYYVYSATPDLKFGLSLGSDFGLSARYQSNWSGRYYTLQEEFSPSVPFRSRPIGSTPGCPLAPARRSSTAS